MNRDVLRTYSFDEFDDFPYGLNAGVWTSDYLDDAIVALRSSAGENFNARTGFLSTKRPKLNKSKKSAMTGCGPAITGVLKTTDVPPRAYSHNFFRLRGKN
jgi:hypothetical protein